MSGRSSSLKKCILLDEELMGEMAAIAVANFLHTVRGPKVISLAAAPSQDAYLKYLCKQDIDWDTIHIIHLDDYIDLPPNHPNTFKSYLKEHILDEVAISPEHINFILDYTGTPKQMAWFYERRIKYLISWARALDGAYISTIGIGVNGHIAFNEPHVDKRTNRMVIPVELDDVSVQQQFDDYKNHLNPNARYKSLEDVPRSAITISCAGILDSDAIFVIVPGRHKAEAVRSMWDGPITDDLPASLLRTHHNVQFFLDQLSASLLDTKPLLK